MRRWWWTILIVAGLTPAPGAVVVGEGAALWSERVLARVGDDGRMEVIIEPVARRTGAGPVGLLFAVPGRKLEVALAEPVVWPTPLSEPVVRHPWMFTTTPVFLRILRDQRATAHASPELAPAATPADAAEPPRVVADDSLARWKLDPRQTAWAAAQHQAGRRIVGLKGEAGETGVWHGPPIRFEFVADAPFIPFSAPSDPAAPASLEQPYELYILAGTQMQPTYPDGYPPFPALALKCAEPNPSWLGALGPARYATYYQANVPLAARTADLTLKPVKDAPIPPPAPRAIDIPRPVPVDALGGLLLLVILGLIIGRRRRRKAGTTSSASAPDPA